MESKTKITCSVCGRIRSEGDAGDLTSDDCGSEWTCQRCFNVIECADAAYRKGARDAVCAVAAHYEDIGFPHQSKRILKRLDVFLSELDGEGR